MDGHEEATWRARIEEARKRTLAFLDGLQVEGQPRGVSRISAAHDPERWPGVLLPGTYNAIMCRALLGALDSLDVDEHPNMKECSSVQSSQSSETTVEPKRDSSSGRAALINWLISFRRPEDGVFRIPEMTDESVYKRPSLEETWRYIDAHVSNYSLGAIEVLDASALPSPPNFAMELVQDERALKAWLADRDLNDPWLEGNNIVNVGSFLLLLRRQCYSDISNRDGQGRSAATEEQQETRQRLDRALEILFQWHDYNQEPATGFWGLGQLADPQRHLHAMAGSMHNYHLYYATGRKIPYHEKAVDYALSRPTSIDTACIDADLVDLLVHAHRLLDYRRADIEKWMRAKLASLLHFQSADGGFADELYGVRRQDGWVRGGYSEPQGISNTFATWFRWIAIAMIAELLWPTWRRWTFRDMVGLGYRFIPSSATTLMEADKQSTHSKMKIDDPFAHLHDESYASAFTNSKAHRITYQKMITMGKSRQGGARISLNGTWRFTTDLFDEGLRQKWYLDTPEEYGDPKQWLTPRDYDESGAEILHVPSSWSTSRPEWLHFEGAGWYARIFSWSQLSRDASKLFLRVGAANYQGLIFLNGRFLGFHRGGSTPFFVELTPHLLSPASQQQGTAADEDAIQNHLLIQVDNRRTADRVPMNHFDWFNYGGIYRDIELITLPDVYIQDFFIQLIPDGTLRRISATVSVSGVKTTGQARLVIEDLHVDAYISITEGVGSIELNAAPELWSPESPRLYDVQVSFGSDRLTERIGFREIRTSGHQILLNGKPIYLRGVCVHEDDITLGKVSTEADIRRRFEHALELGCNFLRLAHYPHHELAAQIADELGLLLWEEVPVYWAIQWDNPETYADAENQLLELVMRDRNRASVIMWGVGNENADTDARYSFMSRLAQAVRRLDTTRLVTAACLIDRTQFRIYDRLTEHLDVIGVNEYFGWYEPDFAGLERLLANSQPSKPVIISEFGADALAGHHGGPRELFTEECQAEFYRRQIELLSRASYVQGLCAWLLYDFRSERRQTRFQRGFNRKGLIAEDKETKKLAFFTLAAHYNLLKKADHAV